MNEQQNQNILVLGLGNILLADDGVGVHVVRRLTADPATPAWVQAVDGGTMGFRLSSMLRDGGDVLMIDAADLAAIPGTMRLLDAEALAGHVARGRPASAHEAGLADLLGLMRLANVSPRQLAVLAIQPGIVDWGEALSEPVAKAVGPACALVKATAADWRMAR